MNQQNRKNKKQASSSKKGRTQKVLAPQSIGFKKSTAPRVISSIGGPGNPIIIKHSERLTKIVSNASALHFEAIHIPVNPGMPNYSWLSQMARNYEKYRFLPGKCFFRYVPRCTTATSGSIALAIEYDAKDGNPTTYDEILDQYGSSSGPVWTSISIGLNLIDRQYRFSRSGTNNSANIRLTDIGKLHIGSESAPGNTALGDVYFDYEVELSYPQVNHNGTCEVQFIDGLDVTHPVGTAAPVVPDGQSIPFHHYDDETLEAVSPFEGTITDISEGTTVTDMALTSPSATLELISTATNGTESISIYKIIAGVGDTLKFVATMATLTSHMLYFARGRYSAL